MKVKLLVSRCGAKGAQNVGEEIDVSADEAERMVAAGQAEIVRKSKPQNTSRRVRAEKAAK